MSCQSQIHNHLLRLVISTTTHGPSLRFILSPRMEKKEKDEDTDMMPKDERADDEGDSSNVNAVATPGWA